MYPIGWYSSILRPADIPQLVAEGATVVMPYGGAGSPQLVRVYLDEAEEHGIAVLMDMHAHPPLLSAAQLQAEIAYNAAHPSCIGWYLADEPETYGASEAPSVYAPLYAAAKAADPSAPVAMAFAHTVPPAYVSVADLLLVDHYPGWSEPVQPQPFYLRLRLTYNTWRDAANAATAAGKQWGAVLSGFGNDKTTGAPNNGMRNLSDPELRYYLASALVFGPDMVLFYTDDWADSTMRARVSALMREIVPYGELLRDGVTDSGQIAIAAPAGTVRYRYGGDGTRHALLIVNIAGYDNAGDEGLTLPAVRMVLPAGARDVHLAGSPVLLPLTNGAIVDTLEPFASRLYVWESA